MQAAIYRRYGSRDEVRVEEVAAPVAGPGEVLLDVVAAALNPKDVLIRKGRFSWLSGRRFPMGLGFDVAGVVAEMGPEVTGLQRGQLVFGHRDGFRGGTCAQQVVMPADGGAPVPRSLDAVKAASLSLAAQTALQAMRDQGGLLPGQRVYIHGASGGVGTLAIQIARALGAHVTASAAVENHALLRTLGAHDVVDRKTANVHSSGQRYDVFFDVFGNQPFSSVRDALTATGTWVNTVPGVQTGLAVLLHGWRYPRARLIVVKSRRADLQTLSAWCDEGKLRPIIHAVYPLHQVGDAQAQVESKASHGKVVVMVQTPAA